MVLAVYIVLWLKQVLATILLKLDVAVLTFHLKCTYLTMDKSLNNKSQVDMIIMDFSTAFDTVPHNRLLNELKGYGINNKTLAWYKIQDTRNFI